MSVITVLNLFYKKMLADACVYALAAFQLLFNMNAFHCTMFLIKWSLVVATNIYGETEYFWEVKVVNLMYSFIYIQT